MPTLRRGVEMKRIRIKPIEIFVLVGITISFGLSIFTNDLISRITISGIHDIASIVVLFLFYLASLFFVAKCSLPIYGLMYNIVKIISSTGLIKIDEKESIEGNKELPLMWSVIVCSVLLMDMFHFFNRSYDIVDSFFISVVCIIPIFFFFIFVYKRTENFT
jgi:hypothetical protein